MHCVMKKLLLFTMMVLCFTMWNITGMSQEKNSEKEEKNDEYYKVTGYRHGISYFKKAHYQDTKPLKEGELDFKHYHTYDETVFFLKKWAEKFPDLIDLYVSGKSFEGRDIPQVTLTNKKTGKDTDKPAILIDACTHSLEVVTSESALWMLDYLLENYGKNKEITTLIDTKALYFRILNNPDGSELCLNTVLANRSTVRPHDDDRDGLLDEDPGEDLDGDGFIRDMRKKVGSHRGKYILDPRDSTKRLMKRVKDGEGDWDVYREGIDNDGDGKYNEDGIGGLDLHRNYPVNWRPEPGFDATERGYTQVGAGEFPLSEPEIRCFFLFLLTHTNISIVNSMHSEYPMHLHGPSTSLSKERMYPDDITLYHYFDREGKKITGYRWAGEMYDYLMRRKINAATGDSTRMSYNFGHGLEFGYWVYGSLWYGDELWCWYGADRDYNNDGEYDQYDGLCWVDEFCGEKEYKTWEKYNHPQLGEVEIGGNNYKFYWANPPAQFLEEWIEKEAMFNIFLAKHLPQIEILSIDVTPSKEKYVYDIEVRFTNTGFLPTALEQAKLVKIVRQDRVRLEFDKDLTKDKENKKVEVVIPETHKKDIEMGWTKKGEIKKARFTVKLNGIKSAQCTVHVLSSRGGHKKEEITIGEK